MPLYDYVNEAGDLREVYFGMDEVCEIGATIEHAGEKLTRVPSREGGNVGGVVHDYYHVSHSLPRIDPKNPYWKRWDKSGKPAFTSKREVEELTSKLRGEYASGFQYG